MSTGQGLQTATSCSLRSPEDFTHLLAARPTEAMAVSRPRRRAAACTQCFARRLPFSLRGGGLSKPVTVPTLRQTLATHLFAIGPACVINPGPASPGPGRREYRLKSKELFRTTRYHPRRPRWSPECHALCRKPGSFRIRRVWLTMCIAKVQDHAL